MTAAFLDDRKAHFSAFTIACGLVVLGSLAAEI
jgi:hypothetical protein